MGPSINGATGGEQATVGAGHEGEPGGPAPTPVRDDLSVTGLVTRARNGDQQAWDTLVERYAR